MSQSKEKYARRIERRVDKLENRVESIEIEQIRQGGILAELDEDLAVYRAAVSAKELKQAHEEVRANIAARRARRERERKRQRVLRAILFALVAVLVLVIVARAWTSEPEEITAFDPTTVTVTEAPVLAILPQATVHTLEAHQALDFDAMIEAYLANPAAEPEIEEILLMQTYFSVAVPMPYEYQAYMRIYCAEYGCLYTLALAVAQTESRFDMEAIGAIGEVGMMQLNPGPEGAYHDEIEAATGLDPTTPEGNIAGGCYLLGKYMAMYNDVEKAAMAYNMGHTGAKRAWEQGITSTEYSREVLAAMENWGCVVNAWNGI